MAFVEAVVVFDAFAIVAALAIGAVVAPALVIVHASREWKRHIKWIAAAPDLADRIPGLSPPPGR